MIPCKAQLGQDLLVMFLTRAKREGFFVEFGAADGVFLSNTWFLEKELGWNGILAEPALCWHENLKANRNCRIDTRCVWAETGKTLKFIEPVIPEMSTLEMFTNRDYNKAVRATGLHYWVETVSLDDLLADAPKVIDYMSVDTEGSEFAILQSFDFSRHEINIITVEHNYVASDREHIQKLLFSKGYAQLFNGMTHFEDWYARESFLQRWECAGA